MSKNDYVKVYVKSGIELREFSVVASQNGRRVELEVASKEVIASEITRGGTLVKKIQFPRDEVVAIESVIGE